MKLRAGEAVFAFARCVSRGAKGALRDRDRHDAHDAQHDPCEQRGDGRAGGGEQRPPWEGRRHLLDRKAAVDHEDKVRACA